VVMDRFAGHKSVHLVDIKDQRKIKTIDERWIEDVATSVDGNTLFTIGGFGLYAMELNAKDGFKQICSDDKVRGTRFAFLPGDPRMVVANEDEELTIYNFEGYAFDVIHKEKYTKEIVALAASPDGMMVATGDDGGMIKLWNAKRLSRRK
jgi:WD40 repeat protein